MTTRALAEGRRVCTDLNLFGKVDVDEVARALGIQIDSIDFMGDNIHEIAIGKCIAVRSTLEYRARRWAIAHGIGHVLLHPEGNHVWLHMNEQRKDRDQYEIEAESFAHELLVGSVKNLHNRLADNTDTAAYYGVPERKAALTPMGGFE